MSEISPLKRSTTDLETWYLWDGGLEHVTGFRISNVVFVTLSSNNSLQPLTFEMHEVNNTAPTLNHPSALGHQLTPGTLWHRYQLRMLNFATRHTIRITYRPLVQVTIAPCHQLLSDLQKIFVNHRYWSPIEPATLQAPMHTHSDTNHLMTADIKLLVVGVRCMGIRLAKVQCTPVNRVETLTLPRLAEDLTIWCILGPCDNYDQHSSTHSPKSSRQEVKCVM